MRNKYPSDCYRCGKRVDVGAGHFERQRGSWQVQHVNCCVTHRELRLVHSVDKSNAEHKQEIIDAAIEHAKKLGW